MELSLFFTLFLAIFCAAKVSAGETHTIRFINQCGHGTPCLVLNGQNISTGQDYTTNGVFSGIAYLQTGQCLANGEGCTLVEINMINPTCAGCGSTVDISLISPHVYNVEASFAFYNGCDGYGADCNGPNCATAFYTPDDWYVQRACQVDNVDLLIAFCADASNLVSGGSSSLTTSSSTSTSTHLQSSSATPTTPHSSLSSVYPVDIGGTTSTTSSSVPSPSAKRCLTRPSNSALARRKPAAVQVPRRHRALRD